MQTSLTAFHSGARHAAALEQPGRVIGHHGMLVFGWFISLVFLLPLIAAVAIVVRRCSSLFSAGSLDELMAGLRGMIRFILLVLGGGVLLTLPLLPFRSLMLADMVRQAGDTASPEKQ